MNVRKDTATIMEVFVGRDGLVLGNVEGELRYAGVGKDRITERERF